MSTEEIKMIVDLLSNVSHGALGGAVLFMVLQFFKWPIMLIISGHYLIKYTKGSRKVIEIEE